MAYRLTQITLPPAPAGEAEDRMEALWRDIASGRLPLLFDSEGTFQPGLSPVIRYDRDGGGLTILAVRADFFRTLERETARGAYKRYETAGGSLEECGRGAWAQVREDEAAGVVKQDRGADYESPVPGEYTKDGEPRCFLYVAMR